MTEAEIWLGLIAIITSFVSAVMGLGGGTILIAGMADFLSPKDLIPIHGIAQLHSNLSRAILMRKHIHWPIVRQAFGGVLVGAAIGSKLSLQLPESKFLFVLGAFILLMTWLPKHLKPPRIPMKWSLVGFSSTFLSMFIGATGPLSAPFFLTEGLSKTGVVATQAAYQIITHGMKVVAFLIAGFSIILHWKLILWLSIAAWLGTWIGEKIHHRIDGKRFVLYYKLVLSALATRLILTAL